VPDAKADRARVDEHDRVLGRLPQALDLADDKVEAVLRLLLEHLAVRHPLVERVGEREERRVQARGVDLGVDEVGRDRDVAGASRLEHGEEHSVDLLVGVLGGRQVRLRAGHARRRVLENVKACAQRGRRQHGSQRERASGGRGTHDRRRRRGGGG